MYSPHDYGGVWMTLPKDKEFPKAKQTLPRAPQSVNGSHPHMVHEMVSALIEKRDPWPNARTAANWTCVGLCAHKSAKKGGKIVKLPGFTLK